MRDIAGDRYVRISLHIDVIFERDELDKVRVEKLLMFNDILDKCLLRRHNQRFRSLMLNC